MAESPLVTTLSNVDLFHGLPSRVLDRIAESGHEATYAPGESVIEQGESVAGFKAFSPTGVEMHVILAGAADVVVDGAPQAGLGVGDYFGELSLIDGEPRSADVVAGPAGLTTFALSKWTFESLREKHPEVAIPMLRVLCARLRAGERSSADR
jgi:CRP/FNR family cyclic AMP-dependent transcriptional regulator